MPASTGSGAFALADQHPLEQQELLMAVCVNAAWDRIDAFVAWLFGLDESKYQWAIDRYHRQQAEVCRQYTVSQPPGLMAALLLHACHTAPAATRCTKLAPCQIQAAAA